MFRFVNLISPVHFHYSVVYDFLCWSSLTGIAYFLKSEFNVINCGFIIVYVFRVCCLFRCNLYFLRFILFLFMHIHVCLCVWMHVYMCMCKCPQRQEKGVGTLELKLYRWSVSCFIWLLGTDWDPLLCKSSTYLTTAEPFLQLQASGFCQFQVSPE